MDMDTVQESSQRNQLLWFAGAVGTAVGVAVWAYSRKEPTYWEKTMKAAGQIAESAADINPWVGVGTGTAALGGAALAYRLKRPKPALQVATERAGELVSQARRHIRPGAVTFASAAISLASALSKAKTRKRAAGAIADGASTAADSVAEIGSRIWQRLQTISEEGSKIYPHLRKMVA